MTTLGQFSPWEGVSQLIRNYLDIQATKPSPGTQLFKEQTLNFIFLILEALLHPPY